MNTGLPLGTGDEDDGAASLGNLDNRHLLPPWPWCPLLSPCLEVNTQPEDPGRCCLWHRPGIAT